MRNSGRPSATIARAIDKVLAIPQPPQEPAAEGAPPPGVAPHAIDPRVLLVLSLIKRNPAPGAFLVPEPSAPPLARRRARRSMPAKSKLGAVHVRKTSTKRPLGRRKG